MKRWQNIVAVGGFLIVLAFVAERFFSVRGSWADLRNLWRDSGRDLVVLGLFILGIAALLLAIFAIPYLWWKKVRRGAQKKSVAELQYSFRGQMRHLVELAILSAFLGFVATAAALGGRSVIGIPGWWVALSLNDLGNKNHFDVLGFSLLLAIVVNSAIYFAVFWGGCLLWMRSRRNPTQISEHCGE